MVASMVQEQQPDREVHDVRQSIRSERLELHWQALDARLGYSGDD
jgi:hypothetical protein